MFLFVSGKLVCWSIPTATMFITTYLTSGFQLIATTQKTRKIQFDDTFGTKVLLQCLTTQKWMPATQKWVAICLLRNTVYTETQTPLINMEKFTHTIKLKVELKRLLHATNILFCFVTLVEVKKSSTLLDIHSPYRYSLVKPSQNPWPPRLLRLWRHLWTVLNEIAQYIFYKNAVNFEMHFAYKWRG